MRKEPERRRRGRSELETRTENRLGAAWQGALPCGASLLVQQYLLENGLRVLLVEDHAAPVVAYHTWFRVGSRHEQPGKTGLAHLLEHMMFNEFEGVKAGEFDRRMEQAGAETNAATSFDWTYYYEQVPSSQLGLVIDLEANRMGRMILREEPFRSELEVVTNERRSSVDDDVDGAVSETLYALAYTAHAYRNPTIGHLADIAGLTREDCEGFWRTYYAPNNATIVVAGSFDEIRVMKRIAERYAYLDRMESPVEDVHPEPPQAGERRETMRKPSSTEKVALGYHAPAFGDVDHAPLQLMCDILFGGRSSRVHRSLVQQREIAVDARGYAGAFAEPGLLEMQLTAREGHGCDELLEALDKEIARVVAEPVTEAELDRAKAREELGLVRGMETCGGKAEQVAFFDVMLGDPCGAMNRLERLRKTTRTDLLRAARRYLRQEARTVVNVLPNGSPKVIS